MTSSTSPSPAVGDIVLVGQSKHPRRVVGVVVAEPTFSGGSSIHVERVDGKSDGCRYVTPADCRVLEAHPGGAR